jgi:sugar transferase (PEP-CTERM/EpsH1 system associated)
MPTAESKTGKAPVPVLYLTTELAMGGAERALLHLLTNLNRERFNPTVACLYNGDGVVGQAIRELDITVYDAQMRGKADLGALSRIYQHVRSQRPTILHTNLFHANLPGRITGRLVGVPIIISSERTMAMESEWRYWLNRWTIGMVDRVVAVSKKVGEFCINHIRLPAHKVVVIHNGVEIPPFSPYAIEQARQVLGIPQEALVCGAVSRLEPVKGIDDLILAFAQVRANHDAHLVIVGNGSQRERLVSLAQGTGVSDWVIWTGYRDDVLQLLPAFDIFIQPSHHEGLPNTVLEAMAAGLPVVATSVGGTPELVVNGETGLLVPSGDSDALAGAITELLEHPEVRDRLGQAGQERVKLHFSVDEMVRKIEQLYEQLLAEKMIQ